MNDREITGMSVLPHREPFLFLDRVVSHDAKGSVGIVTFGPERDFFRAIRLSRALSCWRRCASRPRQAS